MTKTAVAAVLAAALASFLFGVHRGQAYQREMTCIGFDAIHDPRSNAPEQRQLAMLIRLYCQIGVPG